MKKLTAILISCIMLTASLVSCGSSDDDDDDSSSSAPKYSANDDSTKSSKSDDDDEETSTKDDDEKEPTTKDDDDEETSTKDDDEETTTKDDEEPTTSAKKKSSSKKIELSTEGIVGKWSIAEEGGFIFKEDGKANVYYDFSSYVTSDGKSLLFDGEDVSEYTTFDGTNLVVNMEGMDLFNMTRIDSASDSSSYYGKYKINSGYFLDAFASEIDGKSFVTTLDIQKDSTTFCMEDICSYEVNGDKLRFYDLATELFDTTGDEETMTAVLNGDELSLTDSSGETEVLTFVE